MTVKLPLRIGIAGLGTVGDSVVAILKKNSYLIAQRAGRAIEITAVSARSRNKPRQSDFSGFQWHDDPLDLAGNPDVDVVVELMGGAEGPAKNMAQRCAKLNKPFVTANKALLATHGLELARAFAVRQTPFMAEAAVAGGIPVMKVLSEGLAANRINSIKAILNGTCNFILTGMENGDSFANSLREAQRLGYAEAEPSFDIDGMDSAQKLVILAATAFGIKPDISAVNVAGIRQIEACDIAYARADGYRIKLLGLAQRTQEGGISCSVEPCLVRESESLARISGVTNALLISGDFIGSLMLSGPGAGGDATASAVIADLIDLASGRSRLPFGRPVEELDSVQEKAQRPYTYYLRGIASARQAEGLSVSLASHLPVKSCDHALFSEGRVIFTATAGPITYNDAVRALADVGCPDKSCAIIRCDEILS